MNDLYHWQYPLDPPMKNDTNIICGIVYASVVHHIRSVLLRSLVMLCTFQTTVINKYKYETLNKCMHEPACQ